MIIFLAGRDRSPSLQAADVLFLSGRPGHPDSPPFEHVALVAGRATPESSRDWGEVRIYGLPESVDPDVPELGLVMNKSEYWRKYVVDDALGRKAPLGNEESIWTLVMRASVTEAEADSRMTQMPMEAGMGRYRYAHHFHIEENDGVKCTNCLGFVVDFLTNEFPLAGGGTLPPLTKDALVVREFPEEYEIGYAARRSGHRMRRTPSPGHLACSLARADRSRPYGEGMDRAEIEATALAKYFVAGMLQQTEN